MPMARFERRTVMGACLILAHLVSALHVATRLDELQMLHAHNSYHGCPSSAMSALYTSSIGQLVSQAIDGGGPGTGAWGYGNPSPYELLNTWGVRSLEFDIHMDDVGGKYSYRAGPKLAVLFGLSTDKTALRGPPELDTPGWKVLHVPDFDFESSCASLPSCLGQVAQWSADHPGHAPIFIHVELKEWRPDLSFSMIELLGVNALLGGSVGTKLGPPMALGRDPDPDADHLLLLEKNIFAAFNRSQVFTPDDFKAGHVSIQERLAADGWPTLAAMAGKVVFMALGSSNYRELANGMWPKLEGSPMFWEGYVSDPASLPRDPNTVFAQTEAHSLLRNDPAVSYLLHRHQLTPEEGQQVTAAYAAALARVVGTGRLMVRAVADSDTVQARNNELWLAWGALQGGAHMVHTDFPNGRSGLVSQCGSFNGSYTVQLLQTRVINGNTSFVEDASIAPRLATACNAVNAQHPCTHLGEDSTTPPAWCDCYAKATPDYAVARRFGLSLHKSPRQPWWR